MARCGSARPKAGAFVRRFGSTGTGNGQFNNPEGVAIDSQGNAWVADWENGRVQEFGSEPGQLQGPAAIAVGPNDNVWVADWSGHSVSAFNSKGEYLRRFGSQGTGSGQFTHPVAIAADLTGHVWVADQQNGRIEEFTERAHISASSAPANRSSASPTRSDWLPIPRATSGYRRQQQPRAEMG